MWLTYPTLPLLAVLRQVDVCQGVGLFTRWFDSKQEKPKGNNSHTLWGEKWVWNVAWRNQPNHRKVCCSTWRRTKLTNHNRTNALEFETMETTHTQEKNGVDVTKGRVTTRFALTKTNLGCHNNTRRTLAQIAYENEATRFAQRAHRYSHYSLAKLVDL